MTQAHARPEDRSRSGLDGLLAQPWADTRPVCFRSEGFAEDLLEASALTSLAARGGPSRAGRSRRPGGALLGVALAGVLGVFSR